MRQPLEPVGINAAGLYATASGVEVSFDNDAGTDHVAYRPGEFLDRCESIHRGKDAAGVFRRQSVGVLPWLTQRYRYQPGFDLTHPWYRAKPNLTGSSVPKVDVAGYLVKGQLWVLF